MEYEKLLAGNDYAELRVEHSIESLFSIKDSEVKRSSGSAQGMSVRVLQDGSWGFASATKGRESPAELLRTAERLARLSKGRILLADVHAESKEMKDSIAPIDADEQAKTLLDAIKEMTAPQVSSRVMSCTDSFTRKEFYNSHGARIIQETGYTYLSCTCIARSGETIQRGSERSWSRSGFGAIKTYEAASKSREKTLRLLDAAPPPKGRFTAVLDPEMTGVFSHEAVGHACEADSVVDKESILAERIGKRIGNELVTIKDEPGAQDFGRYYYDDEGVEAKAASLVEKGILKGYLNSRETAKELGHLPNGHARAGDYGQVPIVRMSNTYFQKGGSSVEDVFDIASGIYLKGMKGGSVDIFSGGFMFKAEEAYEIKSGEKGRIMRDVTITGNILQTLLDVECVGTDFGTSPGVCGKNGQEVPVSDGGPHIRVKNVTIG